MAAFYQLRRLLPFSLRGCPSCRVLSKSAPIAVLLPSWQLSSRFSTFGGCRRFTCFATCLSVLGRVFCTSDASVFLPS